MKGHADVVGDLVKRLRGGRLPGFCLSTILPLYDFWTYNGMISVGGYTSSRGNRGPLFEQKLRDHVSKAIYSRTVSWRGPSAEQGLWDFETNVPPLPTLITNEDDCFVLGWGDTNDENTPPATLTPVFNKEELGIARKIANLALERGGSRRLGDDTPTLETSEPSWLTMRRLGYSYKENPNGYCTMIDSRCRAEPLHAFIFEVTDETSVPAYTLKDCLQAILDASKKTAPLPLVSHIEIDDRALLPPLDTILVKTFEEVGLVAPAVEFYGIGT